MAALHPDPLLLPRAAKYGLLDSASKVRARLVELTLQAISGEESDLASPSLRARRDPKPYARSHTP